QVVDSALQGGDALTSVSERLSVALQVGYATFELGHARADLGRLAGCVRVAQDGPKLEAVLIPLEDVPGHEYRHLGALDDRGHRVTDLPFMAVLSDADVLHRHDLDAKLRKAALGDGLLASPGQLIQVIGLALVDKLLDAPTPQRFGGEGLRRRDLDELP